jgi:hypothetical protein
MKSGMMADMGMSLSESPRLRRSKFARATAKWCPKSPSAHSPALETWTHWRPKSDRCHKNGGGKSLQILFPPLMSRPDCGVMSYVSKRRVALIAAILSIPYSGVAMSNILRSDCELPMLVHIYFCARLYDFDCACRILLT